MTGVRTVLADYTQRFLVVLGLALLLLGAAGPEAVEVVAVLGIVTLFAALLLAEPIGELLRPADDPSGDALAVLRERYARGDLDRDEFERRVEDLVETEDTAVATPEYDRERAAE